MAEKWHERQARLEREWQEKRQANADRLAAQRTADKPSVKRHLVVGNASYGRSVRSRYDQRFDDQLRNINQKLREVSGIDD
jgi:hypothetical protein